MWTDPHGFGNWKVTSMSTSEYYDNKSVMSVK